MAKKLKAKSPYCVCVHLQEELLFLLSIGPPTNTHRKVFSFIYTKLMLETYRPGQFEETLEHHFRHNKPQN